MNSILPVHSYGLYDSPKPVERHGIAMKLFLLQTSPALHSRDWGIFQQHRHRTERHIAVTVAGKPSGPGTVGFSTSERHGVTYL